MGEGRAGETSLSITNEFDCVNEISLSNYIKLNFIISRHITILSDLHNFQKRKANKHIKDLPKVT
jgi:hypothetical protein